MPSVLKARNPALIYGATFAIGILLLVGAELVSVLSSAGSGEQRASQAVYTAFGYHEDCHAAGSTTAGRASYWCGYALRSETCNLVVDSSSGTHYYSCHSPPEGSIEGDPEGPGLWACVVDYGGDTGMKLVGAAQQNHCQRSN